MSTDARPISSGGRGPRTDPLAPSPLGTALTYAALGVGALVMLVPAAWMISTSLKTFAETMADPPTLLPARPNWSNYPEALADFAFGRYVFNSLVVTLGCVAGTLVSSSLAAYGLVCFQSRAKAALFAALLATLMLPSQVTAVPLFGLFAWLGWIDTFAPLIVPSWLGTNVFATFLLRQFFLRVPRDYVEAARLDGASELRILMTVFVPLARPALVTAAVFTFVGAWNDLWGPLLYLHDERNYTLPLGLLQFMGESWRAQGTPWHLFMTIATVMVLPIVLLFFCAQRYFVEGISSAGVKG